MAGCNKSWGARDLHAVQRKLEQIGVSGVPDLLRFRLSAEVLHTHTESNNPNMHNHTHVKFHRYYVEGHH